MNHVLGVVVSDSFLLQPVGNRFQQFLAIPVFSAVVSVNFSTHLVMKLP
tara:strand:+ start:310 stop:456 length:147 start_codon:yes stop_codon:yes gene_type:complete